MSSIFQARVHGTEKELTKYNISKCFSKFVIFIIPEATKVGIQDQLGIKKKILGKVVKKLTARTRSLDREAAPSVVPFERRLDDILERLDLPLSPEKRKEVKKMAFE